MSDSSTELPDQTLSEGLLAAGRGRIFAEAEALRMIGDSLDESFVAAVRLIRMAQGKVVTVGVGTSGPVARRMAHLLSQVAHRRCSYTQATRSMADSVRSRRQMSCWPSRRAVDPPS